MMKTKILGLAAALAALLLNSCAGYKLGSMLPPDIQTVYVPTFINKTKEPLIEIDTTQKAIQEIQRDGSLKVASKESADAILQVTLTDYSLTPVRYDTQHTTQTKEYRLWLTANLVLKRAKDDKVIVDRPMVRGQAVFEVLGDLTSSKLIALPLAAQDLARNVIATCVEEWPSKEPAPATPASPVTPGHVSPAPVRTSP